MSRRPFVIIYNHHRLESLFVVDFTYCKKKTKSLRELYFWVVFFFLGDYAYFAQKKTENADWWARYISTYILLTTRDYERYQSEENVFVLVDVVSVLCGSSIL